MAGTRQPGQTATGPSRTSGAAILGLPSDATDSARSYERAAGARPDPDDPVEILRVLPERFHEQFLAEYYEAASEAARQVAGTGSCTICRGAGG